MKSSGIDRCILYIRFCRTKFGVDFFTLPGRALDKVPFKFLMINSIYNTYITILSIYQYAGHVEFNFFFQFFFYPVMMMMMTIIITPTCVHPQTRTFGTLKRTGSIDWKVSNGFPLFSTTQGCVCVSVSSALLPPWWRYINGWWCSSRCSSFTSELSRENWKSKRHTLNMCVYMLVCVH